MKLPLKLKIILITIISLIIIKPFIENYFNITLTIVSILLLIYLVGFKKEDRYSKIMDSVSMDKNTVRKVHENENFKRSNFDDTFDFGEDYINDPKYMSLSSNSFYKN